MIVGRLEARGPRAWPDQLLSLDRGPAGACGLVLAVWRLAVGGEGGFSGAIDEGYAGPWVWAQIYLGPWAFEISIDVGRRVVTDDGGETWERAARLAAADLAAGGPVSLEAAAAALSRTLERPQPPPHYSALRPTSDGPQPCGCCDHPLFSHKMIVRDSHLHPCLVDGCDCGNYEPAARPIGSA